MLQELIDSGLDQTIQLRHDLHAKPELAYEEVETSRRVQAELRESGISFVAGLGKGTGILGHLPATQPGGKTIALRADMDALPIHEETGLPYASQTPGKMHACGHDGHTAILVGVARTLARLNHRPNDVLFVFQPAEEGGAGARAMCEDGILEGRVMGATPEYMFGLHNWPSAPLGQILWRYGTMMAATNTYTIRVIGKGGHAASPHITRDPIIAAAQIVQALQSVVSRRVNPLDSIVISVTAFQAGTTFNVIPEQAVLKGTMRTLLPETRELGREQIHTVAQGIAESLGCRAEIDWVEGYPSLVNDNEAVDLIKSAASRVVGEDRLHELADPVMGGEDFSYYGEYTKAAFFFVGSSKPEGSPNVHTSTYDFNDEIIRDCTAIMCELALMESKQ